MPKPRPPLIFIAASILVLAAAGAARAQGQGYQAWMKGYDQMFSGRPWPGAPLPPAPPQRGGCGCQPADVACLSYSAAAAKMFGVPNSCLR